MRMRQQHSYMVKLQRLGCAVLMQLYVDTE